MVLEYRIFHERLSSTIERQNKRLHNLWLLVTKTIDVRNVQDKYNGVVNK